MYQIRTDLALETQEKMQEDHVELKGVRFLEDKLSPNLTVSTVVIETENGAKTMGKPKGTYITIEAADMDEEDEDYHREVSEQLARVIRQLVRLKKESLSVLIAGLGNREVTPDALGPGVVDNLFITRHVVKEYGKYAFGKQTVNRISSLCAGRDGADRHGDAGDHSWHCRRQSRIWWSRWMRHSEEHETAGSGTIQVTDTGINPGSGVGNHRHALDEKSLGVPVISIGVPTVVDAATIVNDTMYNLVTALTQSQAFAAMGNSLEKLNDAEKYELIRELLSPILMPCL